ncbi:MAG: NAD(P)H-dependent oxidoreductase [Chlamydiota bacterium]|nr:NAD(P)H-dependent oxidoreductase [Chlamydiota bacterium]
MSNKPQILAFSGSLQKKSKNRMLLDTAIKGAKNAGASVIVIDLQEFPLPIYNEDYEKENGLPENVKALKKLMKDSDGLLIASPEYNSSISGALKNMIDWVSRRESSDEPMLDSFNGKVAAIMSASPGGLGGIRGLIHLRSILSCINVLVLPQQYALSSAHTAFDESGSMIDEKQALVVAELGKSLADILTKIYHDNEK